MDPRPVELEEYIASLYYSRRTNGLVEAGEIMRALPTLAHAREVCRYKADLLDEGDYRNMKQLKFWAEGSGREDWQDLMSQPLSSIEQLKAAYNLWKEFDMSTATSTSNSGTPYLGTEGEILDVEVRLLRYVDFQSKFGDMRQMRAYTFETKEGQKLIWFTDRKKDYSKDFFEVRCKVKRHQEYKGMPQTKVSDVIPTDVLEQVEKSRARRNQGRYGRDYNGRRSGIYG